MIWVDWCILGLGILSALLGILRGFFREVATLAQQRGHERAARRRVRIEAPRLANVGDEREAAIGREAEPRTPLREIAAGQDRRRIGIGPPMRGLRGTRVVLVAVRREHDAVVRMRVERDDGEAHDQDRTDGRARGASAGTA